MGLYKLTRAGWPVNDRLDPSGGSATETASTHVQRSHGMSVNVRELRDRAVAYARQHAKTLALELIQWQDSGLLAEGRMRELALIWAEVDSFSALDMAERTAVRSILEAYSAR